MPLLELKTMFPIGLRAVAVAAVALVSQFAAVPQSFAAEPEELIEKFAAGSTETVDHSTWNTLLKTYVKPGGDGLNRVDYAAFKAAGRDALRSYIAQIEKTDPAKLDRKEQFALLANLYNAKTLDVVLDKYPVKSIKDISLGGGVVASITGGPWKAKVTKLNGVELSLDDIEHAILRPTFKDPRIHYAVNCASIGCPNLPTAAFTGAKLEDQLEAAARAYVNHPRGVGIKDGGVRMSSIYHWYKKDFGGDDAGLLKHFAKYAAPELAASLKDKTSIASHGYDWMLNDAAR